MMQDAYDGVQKLYSEAGLAINNPDIMPDHIGAELNFLSVLLQRINSETESRLRFMDTVNRFLTEHINTWIPEFTRDMEDAADIAFYKALAKVTRHILLDTINPQIKGLIGCIG